MYSFLVSGIEFRGSSLIYTSPHPNKLSGWWVLRRACVLKLRILLRKLTYNRRDLLKQVCVQILANLFTFLNVYVFWEREQGRGRERERETSAGLFAVNTEHHVGLDLTNCEIMASAKIKTWLIKPPRCPNSANFIHQRSYHHSRDIKPFLCPVFVFPALLPHFLAPGDQRSAFPHCRFDLPREFNINRIKRTCSFVSGFFCSVCF